MKNRMDSNSIFFRIGIVCVCFLLCMGMYYFQKNAKIKEMSFSELPNGSLTLSEEAKENIYPELERAAVQELDSSEVVFGVFLADAVDYDYSKEKLQEFFDLQSVVLSSEENLYEKADLLYYHLLLQYVIVGDVKECDCSFVQSAVDEILEGMDYKNEGLDVLEDLKRDVIVTRRMVEIVSVFHLWDMDLHLTKKQCEKIKQGLENILERKGLLMTPIINDIFLIDDILGLGLISEELFAENYEQYANDGREQDIPVLSGAKVSEVYQYMVSFDRMKQYDYVEQQKNFVESKEYQVGLYCDIVEYGARKLSVDFRAIVCGNDICVIS